MMNAYCEQTKIDAAFGVADLQPTNCDLMKAQSWDHSLRMRIAQLELTISAPGE